MMHMTGRTEPQLAGGIPTAHTVLWDCPPSTVPCADGAAARRRKRSAVSPLSDGPSGTKKPRGRPRIEPVGENPVDRRRNQIRIAQRTYRARKETTINLLHDRVEYLKEVIRVSDASVRDLYQLIVDSDLARASPPLLHRLSSVTFNLARALEHVDSPLQAPDDIASTTASSHPQGCHRLTPPPSEESSVDEGAAAIVPAKARETQLPALPSVNAGYTAFTTSRPVHVAHDVTSAPYNPHNVSQQYTRLGSDADHKPEIPPYRGMDRYALQGNGFNAITPFKSADISLAAELPIPHSFSFNEVSFSRFFHRSCLEYASRLLNRPDSRPEEVARVFSHALQYSSLDNIAQRLQMRLLSSAHEDLDSPFTYPASQPEHDLESMRFGPWLGPNELDRYLTSKGIKVNPAAQVMECDMEAPNDGLLIHRPSISAQQGSCNGNGDGAAAGVGMTFESPWQSALNLNRRPRGTRKRFRLDVQKLLNYLVEASRCRGPSPAILRHDVNKAFTTAIISIEAISV